VSLYKRGRKYSISIWVDGIRHLKSTGTTNRREAETIERDFREELNRRRHQIREASPEMTFADLAARFLADGSPRPYHLDRLKVLLPYFGDCPIGTISKSSVREYRAQRHKEKQLTETTLNRDVEVLRHLLYWAMDEGFLTANPLARIRLPKQRPKPKAILTLTEEAKLLGAAAPHLRLLIIAALDSGMRRGELLTQRLEHVDFDRRVLQVTHSKTAGGEAREIPLTARLTFLFAALNDKQKQEALDKRKNPGNVIFTFEGHPIKKIKTAWKAAIRRSGIRYLRFHDLRHTFNTRLMEAGVLQDVRKAIMGHSSGEEVNSLYTHVELPVKREAIRKLEVWTANQQKQLLEEGGNNGTTTSAATDDRASATRDPGGLPGTSQVRAQEG
jgi:integrase